MKALSQNDLGLRHELESLKGLQFCDLSQTNEGFASVLGDLYRYPHRSSIIILHLAYVPRFCSLYFSSLRDAMLRLNKSVGPYAGTALSERVQDVNEYY